mgnify:CR=1 FL=1
MKKRWQTLLCLFLYIVLIAFVMKFDLRRLIDLRSVAALLTGAFLLVLPFCRRGIKREEFFLLYEKKAMEAGLIQTFLLLFMRLSDAKGYAEVLQDVALCFRPILYGLFIKVILAKEGTGSAGEGAGGPGQTPASLYAGAIDGEMLREPSYEDCVKAGLTKREAQIALMICRRYSNREIAEELVISEKTVKKHVSNIFEKTEINKREELRRVLLSDPADLPGRT